MSRDSQTDASRGKGQAHNRASHMQATPAPKQTVWDDKKELKAIGKSHLGATRGAADTKAAGDA